MTLKNADLANTPCPRGTRIEIDGLGIVTITVVDDLLVGVHTAFRMLTEMDMDLRELLNLITILEFDETKKLLKVRIATCS